MKTCPWQMLVAFRKKGMSERETEREKVRQRQKDTHSI